MTYRNAQKLHTGDEVTLKENGTVVRVLTVTDHPTGLKHPTVFIEITNESGSIEEYMHTEVK